MTTNSYSQPNKARVTVDSTVTDQIGPIRHSWSRGMWLGVVTDEVRRLRSVRRVIQPAQLHTPDQPDSLHQSVDTRLIG